MAEFRMPSLGADMESGVLVEWFVAVGDHVTKGDVVAAVDTDKAVIEVEVFDTGVVEQLLVEPGAEVPVGEPLAVIGDAAEPPDAPAAAVSPDAPAVADAPAAPDASAVPAVPAAPEAPAVAVTAGDLATGVSDVHVEDRQPIRSDAGVHHASRVLSPVVRRLADRLHVDVSSVHGTGPGGRVTRADVERSVPAPAPAPSARPTAPSARPPAGPRVRATPRARRRAAELGVDLTHVRGTGPGGAVRESDVAASTGPQAPPPESGTATRPGEDRTASMRRAIARAMTVANREIPHYHLTHLVDVSPLRRWLDETNAARPPATRVLPAAAVVRAVAMALRDVPELNGYWVDDTFVAGEGSHLGLATSLRGGGLIVPVIHDADQKTVDEVMAAMRDLVQRARHGGLRGSELQGASATVTNLGDRGVDTVHGVIHPPQVALVGAGVIADRPVAVDGEVVARPTLFLTLAADHRASDGQVGSRLLRRIAALLQEPADL